MQLDCSMVMMKLLNTTMITDVSLGNLSQMLALVIPLLQLRNLALMKCQALSQQFF